MSDEKPWLEEWSASATNAVRTGRTWLVIDDGVFSPLSTRLIAAAPQLARALALVEDVQLECVVCDQAISQGRPHKAGRIIDAALTAAGLDTAEKREEARRRGT